MQKSKKKEEKDIHSGPIFPFYDLFLYEQKGERGRDYFSFLFPISADV